MGKHPDGSLPDQAQGHALTAQLPMEVKKNFKGAPARESADKKGFRRIIKSPCFFYIICHRSIDFIHGIEWDNL